MYTAGTVLTEPVLQLLNYFNDLFLKKEKTKKKKIQYFHIPHTMSSSIYDYDPLVTVHITT